MTTHTHQTTPAQSRREQSSAKRAFDPIVSALVYVAARAPDAGEDYAALAANFPPANAGLVKSGGFAQLSEEAFLKDFAGGGDQANRRPRGPAKRQE